MIYPITAYGDPILRSKTKELTDNYPDLKKLVTDMYDTMYHAHGVGLAAPQISKGLRLFVIDSAPFEEDEEKKKLAVKQAFINPQILEENGDEWAFEEGCLSIPGIREDVIRPANVIIRYFDEDWNQHEKTFDGMVARIIQHEYDHIEGVLFTDHLSGFRKRLLKSKLTKISKGDVDADYVMRFYNSKKL
ncbi:peptide deformylase [Adhaeribacter radiodurans]|nr:peptide deformylase [Adhaeribacter radiodurans]